MCVLSTMEIPSILSQLSAVQFSLGSLKDCLLDLNMPSVPKEKYPEMDWWAPDKVAAWKVFKHHLNMIFMADQVLLERQYAFILVVGGWQSIQLLEYSWRPGKRPQGSRTGLGSIWAKLRAINLLLALLWYLFSWFQARAHRVNSRPKSTHQRDSPRVQVQEGGGRRVIDWLTVPYHTVLWGP